MIIAVVDGQGGGIGKAIVERLRAEFPRGSVRIIALGTNAVATGQMLKGGADDGATGENAIAVNAVRADIILGPIGVILANGLMGEVPPAVASAVSGAEGVKILIPSNACGTRIAGTEEMKLEEYLRRAVELAAAEMEKKSS